MRDKYNLNTLPPGHEEEYGNLGECLFQQKCLTKDFFLIDIFGKLAKYCLNLLGDAAIEGLVGAKSVEQPSSVTIPGRFFKIQQYCFLMQ